MSDHSTPAHDLESVDLDAGSAPQWALMALDPSGERQLLVKKLTSGFHSNAMLFRGLEGGKLSVVKWNRKAYPAGKMQRPDREVRIAKLLASSGQAARFAELLSSQDMVGGYRESWWEYYNVGDMRDLYTHAFRFSTPPLSLVFRCLAQCLEGIQCLDRLDIRHMDLHAGNIFLHLAAGALYPDAVIGDFGYSRLPGERPPPFTTSDIIMMNSDEKKAHLSPPLSYNETYGTEDRSWRLGWDLKQFQRKISELLLDNFDKSDEKNQLMLSLFKHMADMVQQDEKDRKLPEAERPPIQDLTQTIQDARTLERLYAATAADKKALSELREKLLDVLRREPSEPHIFGSEQEARDEFPNHLDIGLLRVVNLTDKNSVEVATAELAALKVKGSAYVPDDLDKSGSSPHASTRWTPATRGLAEATAFAEGNASAVDALLGVRDTAERDQELVRDEHARRYRGQVLRQLFRR